MSRIFAVDDDSSFLKSMKNLLEFKGYQVETSSNPIESIEIYKKKSFDCALVDVKMPGMDGLELIKNFREVNHVTPIIMVSGQSTISIAVEAIKEGAYDFIEKPVEPDRLLVALKNAIEKTNWSKEKNYLISELDEKYRMVGESQDMQEIYKNIHMLAPTYTKILITGETGTGKELVARALHYQGDRAGKPFIKLNCAAIPPELMESELFGHKRGSFTGAVEDKAGKFKVADGGTLFLDEIGDMDFRLQVKLLRVLEEGEFEMLGSTQTEKIDCRILSATNRNLAELVEQGQFRKDLYHRLNVMNIHVPPLRSRPEDIKPLASYFLEKCTDQQNKTINDFSADAIDLLQKYEWPGNIRQLRNVVEKTVVFATKNIIHKEDVELAMNGQYITRVLNN